VLHAPVQSILVSSEWIAQAAILFRKFSQKARRQ